MITQNTIQIGGLFKYSNILASDHLMQRWPRHCSGAKKCLQILFMRRFYFLKKAICPETLVFVAPKECLYLETLPDNKNQENIISCYQLSCQLVQEVWVVERTSAGSSFGFFFFTWTSKRYPMPMTGIISTVDG